MQALIKALVRLRLAEGWHAWVAPDRHTYWARLVGDDVVQTVTPEPGELDVLDEILREKVS